MLKSGRIKLTPTKLFCLSPLTYKYYAKSFIMEIRLLSIRDALHESRTSKTAEAQISLSEL